MLAHQHQPVALFPFEPPSLQKIVRRVTDDIRTRLGTAASLLSHTAEAALAGAIAGVAHPLHRALDRASRASLWAVTLDNTYLEIWASLFAVYRRDPIPATGVASFSGTPTTPIPSGTRVQRSPDGFEYETTEDAVLDGSGEADVAIEATVAGALGNCSAATPLFLIVSIPGVNSAAYVSSTDITDGADKEGLVSLSTRFLDRLRNPPRGGGKGDYVRWAKEATAADTGASLGITRVWEYGGEPNLGYVTVRAVKDFVNANTAKLTDSESGHLRTYILERMPLGMDCVVPLDEVLVDLDPTIMLDPNTPAVQAEAERALHLALSRGRIGAGSFSLSLLNQALLDVPTITAHEFVLFGVDPVGNFVLGDKEVLTLGTPVWQAFP